MEPTNIPEPEWGDPEPKTISRTPLLIGLGALVIIAAVLAVAKSARDSAGGNSTGSVDIPRAGDADWQASFTHLVDAIETRFAGIDNRLNMIERRDVVPEPVELAADLPEPLDPTLDREPFPAPAPAHVSVPDLEGRDA